MSGKCDIVRNCSQGKDKKKWILFGTAWKEEEEKRQEEVKNLVIQIRAESVLGHGCISYNDYTFCSLCKLPLYRNLLNEP